MNGMQALFPIYLARPQENETNDAYSSAIAQNENNLNQNFELISQKLMELETAILQIKKGGTEG